MVSHLNRAHQWNLSAYDIQSYAEHLSSVYPGIQHSSEERLCVMISNYHADHRLVAALQNQDDPQHGEHWKAWSQHVVRLVAARVNADATLDVATTAYDDLAQEVLADIWQALPAFRYESRLQTWVFTITANRIARSFRAATTQKRRPAYGARSLEQAVGQERFEHPADTSVEEAALAGSLEVLLQRILAEHPDKRLQQIVQLWLHEDLPLRVIGERLSLSVPRIHSLLNDALSILRSEQRLQSWIAPGD